MFSLIKCFTGAALTIKISSPAIQWPGGQIHFNKESFRQILPLGEGRFP